MIIILEGPDGVGKTTLGQYMAKRLGADYIHLTYRWPDHMFEYHTAAIRWAIRKSHKRPVIIDRWWPSEALYAAEFRGGSKWSQMGRMMDRVARKHGAIYVYCLPDDLVEYEKRFDKLKTEREEMYDSVLGVAKRYLKLWSGDACHEANENYADLLVRTGGVKNREDHVYYTIEKYGHIMDYFTDLVAARSAERVASQLPNSMDNPNMLGHLKEAQYLFVGEQVNPKYNNLYWPWYDYGHSSLYLSEALQQVPAREELFMWANARDHDGLANRLIKQVVDVKPEIKVIAVGSIAAREAGVPIFEQVKHPAYVKRFEGGTDTMREILRHAIH
jgi:hypothetical protein